SEYRNRKALIPTIAVVTSIQLSWHVDFPPTNTAFRRHRGFRVTSDSATADLDHSRGATSTTKERTLSTCASLGSSSRGIKERR
ncbi:hypothetical protein MTO96_031656, partial [Rhipicephalus appendiculatus]